MNLGTVLDNLDNPGVQNLVWASPDLLRDVQEAKAQLLAGQAVAHPMGDATLGAIVPVDRGIVGDFADDEGGVLHLALSYTEPRAAAGIAVFGLGLVALPLIAKAYCVDEGLEVEKVGVCEALGFAYDGCKRTREDAGKPLAVDALEKRLGPLDPSALATEILAPEGAATEKGRCSSEEIGRLQECIVRSRASVRRLRRRAALAFMGLDPSASPEEVGQKYKRMALEMHPDKGGDAERFQQLQDMKERLTKSLQEEEDEEEKKKAQEREEQDKLPAAAKARQLRREAHEEAVKLWDTAREAEAEMYADKSMLKGNPKPALARLRSFVEQFSNSRLRMLPHGSREKAQEAFRQFLAEGLELIATAALQDAAAAASTIAQHFNYKVVSRSGSREVARDCQRLLEAVAEVPLRVDAFLVELGRARAEALDAEDLRQTSLLYHFVRLSFQKFDASVQGSEMISRTFNSYLKHICYYICISCVERTVK